MESMSIEASDLLAATESGRICAVAAENQRDLEKCAAKYHDVFSSREFNSTVFSFVGLAIAFSAPWLSAGQLRIANRATLWTFGLDLLIDYRATSFTEVQDIVQRCLAIADGDDSAAVDGLGHFLAEIRDELATASAFTPLRPVWRDELKRMLNGMAREWQWRSARTADGGVALPTFDEYLTNADNFGLSFVYVSHWICTEPRALDDVDELRAAGWETQRVVRLLNDLATYHRDLTSGDLNSLMLGVTRAEVTERLAELTDRCRALLHDLRVKYPQLALYLERQIGFCKGYYQNADYWSHL